MEDPRRCAFQPTDLSCEHSAQEACLTDSQVTAVQKIYQGPVNPRTGEQIFPGYLPGAEANGNNWPLWIAAAQPETATQFLNGNSFYRDAVFEDLTWDYASLDFDSEVRLAHEKAGVVIDATNPDLRPFRARGGKLLHYHGWGDAGISPLSSIAYYEAVRNFLKQYPDANGTINPVIADFYRLFMIPGMGHCTANPEDYNIGNNDFRVLSNDPAFNIFTALVRWVEENDAPAQFVGTGIDLKNPAQSITHPICGYPESARYDGEGDTALASSFTCELQAAPR